MGRKAWKKKIFQRDGWLCRYCGCNVTGGTTEKSTAATIDHIQPVARGGTSLRHNLATACRACNEGKANMTLAEYELAGKPRKDGVEYARSPALALRDGFL